MPGSLAVLPLSPHPFFKRTISVLGADDGFPWISVHRGAVFGYSHPLKSIVRGSNESEQISSGSRRRSVPFIREA